MKKLWPVPVVVLAATALTFAVPTPQTEKPSDRWEYAELSASLARQAGGFVIAGVPGVPGVPGGAAPLPAPLPAPAAAGGKVTWVAGDEPVEADSWEELAAKLKLEGAKSENAAVYKVRVLNHLGGQGWELVSATQSPIQLAGASPGVFVFKRKAK